MIINAGDFADDLNREATREEYAAYTPVAVRKNGLGMCVISHNPETKQFIVSVNGNISGPYTLREIEAARDNFTDLLDMRGMYLYIQDYDIFGEEK